MRAPLMIIGLDGIALVSGVGVLVHMPYLSSLLEERAVQEIECAVPNNSVALWATWFCGADPSVHGLVDFVLHDDATGLYRLVQSSDRAAPSIWDLASARGLRCVVFNVPGTFPASPLNGLMIAGAPVISRAGLTFPARPSTRIENALVAYRSDLEFDLGASDPVQDASAARSMRDILATQIRVMETLLAEPWDVFAGVLTMTDRLLHYYYPLLTDGGADGGETAVVASEGFRLLDGFLEATIRQWRGRARILLVSDHGFQPCNADFHLADWMERRGWFVRADRPAPPPRADLIDFSRADRERSLVLPAPASSMGLRINERLIASPAERRTKAADLRADLETIAGSDGAPLFERVVAREDLYGGHCLSRLPDLLLMTRGGRVALTSRPAPDSFTPPTRPGIHSRTCYCASLDDDGPHLGIRSLIGQMEAL